MVNWKDPEEVKVYHKKWRKNNTDKVKKNTQKWYLKNKKKSNLLNKKWRNDNPNKEKERVKRWHKNNRDRIKIWVENNPERVKEIQHRSKLKRNYNLTVEEYKQLLQFQKNKCGVCGIILTMPCIDHDHQTGKIRGILCNSCNTGLGMLGDNLDNIINAFNYLKQSIYSHVNRST